MEIILVNLLLLGILQMMNLKGNMTGMIWVEEVVLSRKGLQTFLIWSLNWMLVA